VTGESDDFEQSRMNGQLLALNIATPHIINESYDLVVDIHASNGGYVQDPYIFAPVDNDTVANQSANNLTKVLTDLIYYEPASYSSPQYSTIPIGEAGTPALVFELRGSPDYSLEKQASEFVRAVDGLLLN
jgi:predicted deacylase